ncbi:unnamed protein product [Cuscuta campestris]|uniref:Uncharacterized protein n=1 Tax=Cuscuta campestris TaxID=132261 RepID=A0A484LHD3_9ASTE|nr:unnamed protein product [Cuscuta campestris]
MCCTNELTARHHFRILIKNCNSTTTHSFTSQHISCSLAEEEGIRTEHYRKNVGTAAASVHPLPSIAQTDMNSKRPKICRSYHSSLIPLKLQSSRRPQKSSKP